MQMSTNHKAQEQLSRIVQIYTLNTLESVLLKRKCVTCCALTFTDHFSDTAIYLPCNKRASVNKIEKPLNLFKNIDFDANMRMRTCWNCRRIYGSQETLASH